MLQLKNIVKDYVSGDTTTHALKGLSVNFRRNEFAAILGPSGCGKTTLLNITGGLDRYSSGDLVIEGKSTKNFTDSDWDTYRNHSIGFVFQTYNLIGHQNILKNVELALTISGISKQERKMRAEKALERVGLGGLGKKKPNQLSGGQMQRVAIARALVNDPEIVLADEPTGALDSETSVQIMELLKEVAKDRLVIMVTHNPELAERYATRIITMKDGTVLSDTNPYSGETEKERNKVHENKKVVESKGKKEKSSMSFLTAAGLSLSNLRSKMKRTVLVTIAGSIGIIGVSAVLAVSQGVTDYVAGMQDDMLSSYPVKLAEESVDLTSLISGMDASTAKEAFRFDPENPKVGIDSMIAYLMMTYSDVTEVKTNIINQDLMDYIDHAPQESLYSTHKNYGIDPTNNLFTNWKSNPIDSSKPTTEDISLNGLTQRYIAELGTVQGFSSYASYVNLFTDFMKQVPGDKDYILSQYDQLGNSSYDESVNDISLVVDKNNTLTDLIIGQLGFFEHNEFINIARQAMEIINLPEDITQEERDRRTEEIRNKYPYKREFAYEDLIGKELVYLPEYKLYQEGEVADDTQELSIFLMTESYSFYTLTYNPQNDVLSGARITVAPSLNYELINMVRTTPKPEKVTRLDDYLTGTFVAFQEDGTTPKYSVNLLSKTTEATEPNPTGKLICQVTSGSTLEGASGTWTIDITKIQGYHYQAEINSVNPDMIANPERYGGFKLRISSILRLKDSKNFGCLNRGVYYSKAFADKFISDANRDDNYIITGANGFKNYIGSEREKIAQFNAYVKFDYYDYTDDQNPVMKKGYASALNGDLSSSFSDLFSSITGVNYYESDKVHLRSLSGLKVTEKTNEAKEVVGYDFDLIPASISFYPKSFADKDKVTDYLDKWNKDGDIVLSTGKVLSKDARSEITYTDTVKLIITVINTLITVVTVALVSFTSLALVVSCFMIAVITYISVVERTKEIGIIRSVGGRKKDISRLFITETFMTGALSGVFGLIITYIFELIFNVVIGNVFKIYGIANLTIITALIMLAISILLSVLSGLIPSMKASHQDPVIALRSGE